MGFQTEPPNYSSVVDYQGTPSNGEFPQFTDQNTLAGRTATQFLDALATGVTPTELGYLNGVTSGVQTQLDAKAPTADPTFTGPVTVEGWAQFGSGGAAGVIQNDSGNLSVRGNDTLELKSTAESVDIYTNDVLRLRIGNSGSATLDSTFGASLAAALGVGSFSGVYAYKTSNQGSIGTGYTKITLDTERFDTGSNFASSTFTAPTTQKYLFEAIATVGNDTAGNLLALVYYVDGTRSSTTRRESGLTTYSPRIFQIVNTQELSLTAGQTVDLYLYNPANTATVYGVGVDSDTGLTSLRIKPLGA